MCVYKLLTRIALPGSHGASIMKHSKLSQTFFLFFFIQLSAVTNTDVWLITSLLTNASHEISSVIILTSIDQDKKL